MDCLELDSAYHFEGETTDRKFNDEATFTVKDDFISNNYDVKRFHVGSSRTSTQVMFCQWNGQHNHSIHRLIDRITPAQSALKVR